MVKIKSFLGTRKNQIYIGSALVLILIVGVAIKSLSSPKSSEVPAATPEPELTATIKETQGDVTMKQPGQTEFSTAGVGDILQLHGQLQTASSSTARLDLPSGTIIRVAPSSLFTLEDNRQTAGGLTTTLHLIVGQVFIILKGGSLDIQVPSGVASVRGSFMSALIYPPTSKIFVECLEGHCAASNAAGQLDLTNGQKGILIYSGTGSDQSPQLTQMNQNDYASWLAISPESQSIINGNGLNPNGGGGGSNCQPSRNHPCP